MQFLTITIIVILLGATISFSQPISKHEPSTKKHLQTSTIHTLQNMDLKKLLMKLLPSQYYNDLFGEFTQSNTRGLRQTSYTVQNLGDPVESYSILKILGYPVQQQRRRGRDSEDVFSMQDVNDYILIEKLIRRKSKQRQHRRSKGNNPKRAVATIAQPSRQHHKPSKFRSRSNNKLKLTRHQLQQLEETGKLCTGEGEKQQCVYFTGGGWGSSCCPFG